MDFQGQGHADSGETEALGIIDSFSKFLTVIPLPDRQAETLTPQLLDRIYFTHGPMDYLHSDEAQEFMSRLLANVHRVLLIERTTNLGHHAEGNAEIEVVWRYWNRCMRILTPTMYKSWLEYAQRICWAYNSTPQEGLGNVSPYEVMYGTPPRSPFALGPNQDPPPDLDAELVDHHMNDPAEYAAALHESALAFHRLAHAHQAYTRHTTAERLNEQGMTTETTFATGDQVKIYVPATAADMAKTGRRAKHLISWRGPCRVEQKLSATAYRVKEAATNRIFHRTLLNIRPYRATNQAPPPHHDPLTDNPLTTGQLIAVRDDPGGPIHIAEVTEIGETRISVHYLGGRRPEIGRAHV
jgi:hypothetical protein